MAAGGDLSGEEEIDVTLVIIAAETLAVIAVALGVVAAAAALVESQDKERRQ